MTVNGSAMPFRLTVIPFNSPWSLAGLPVLSVPCGFSRSLPVALSLVGAAGSENRLLALGALFQQHTDWHGCPPTDVGDQKTFSGSSRPA